MKIIYTYIATHAVKNIHSHAGVTDRIDSFKTLTPFHNIWILTQTAPHTLTHQGIIIMLNIIYNVCMTVSVTIQ